MEKKRHSANPQKPCAKDAKLSRRNGAKNAIAPSEY